MNTPLINILIRVSRPGLFDRCINSVHLQTYSNINIITYDDIALRERVPYDWNLFCNNLKAQVVSGWFMYLDDDDWLDTPQALERLACYLTDDVDGLIVQFLRNGKPKPSNALIAAGIIRKGLIGGGCLVLHSKHRGLADWQAKPAADYYWIKDIANKIELKFVPLVVQVAGNNGLHGRQTQVAAEERYE